MTRCLTPDEFVDLLDRTLAADRRAHLETCAACRAAAADVRGALALAEGADVPEPPAHFWPGLNARVRAGIEEAARREWRAWLRWDVLVPMVGLAALVMALAGVVERGRPVAGVSAPGVDLETPALAPAPATNDDAYAMMVALVESLPEGDLEALSMRALPEMGEAAEALSADERRALAALLASAVERPAS